MNKEFSIIIRIFNLLTGFLLINIVIAFYRIRKNNHGMLDKLMQY